MEKCNVPFLVLEPAKKEYRALAQTDIDDLIVFSPSSGSKFPMAKLKMVEAIEEYEVLANKIVKDQLGLEKCLENLNRVINKYNNTMKLAMDIEESDAEFYRHMNESIQKLRKNTQILLKSR